MKDFGKKIIRLIDGLIDKSILLVCIVLFLLGSYGLYDSYMVYQQATDNSILKYKPGYEADDETDKKITGNMVAWLTVDDTNIDYPVMQGEDNNEYLNKDPFGDYALSGSIFLDSRNDPEFKDYYSLIYGHHMDHGGMFGDVVEYTDISYFEKHMEGWLYLADATYQIQMFACVETDAYDSMIYGCGADTDLNKLLSYIEEHAVVYKNMTTDRPAQVIGLSTCADARTNGRVIVFGRLEKIS